MSQLLGKFEQNWTLHCVCDECNKYFADHLELALGRDSREALFRIELGLKPAAGAAELLNRRVMVTLEDPEGQFHGARMVPMPTEDGKDLIPVGVPQVGFKPEGKPWTFLTEKELTPENIQAVNGDRVEIKILGVGADLERLRQRLSSLGIEFEETGRLLDQPITEQPKLSAAFDIQVDHTIIRAAAKIGFNYAAKVLGPDVVRRPEFDAARRFIRYGEGPVPVATAVHRSILVGPEAATARVHTCGLGMDRGYLVVVVSLFNEITYGLRLCEGEPPELATIPCPRHLFDPLKRTITEVGIETL